MLKAGIWYVVAAVDGQIRTYRVSRVVSAEPGDERFERPAGFDLAAYWAESAAAYERDVPRIAVDVRVRPDRLGLLRDAVGDAVLNAAEYLTEPDPEGWLRLRVRLDWPDEAPLTMLRAGRWVEVLGPPDVRARVASAARAIVDRYADEHDLTPRPPWRAPGSGRRVAGPRASRAGGPPRAFDGVPAGSWQRPPGTSRIPSWVVRDPIDRGTQTVSAIPVRTCQE